MSQPLSIVFRPLNARQVEAVRLFEQSDILFLLGAAGSGKTHLAVALALREFIDKNMDSIYLTRPNVEAGEKLGSLPGGVEEKVEPFLIPVWDCLSRIVSTKDKKAAAKLFEPAPLAYLRGRTFNNSMAILDEAQNASRAQIKLFLTRLGEGSKMLISGDPHQSDLPKHQKGELMDIVQALEGVPRIGIIYFEPEDCVRHSLVVEILKRI